VLQNLAQAAAKSQSGCSDAIDGNFSLLSAYNEFSFCSLRMEIRKWKVSLHNITAVCIYDDSDASWGECFNL